MALRPGIPHSSVWAFKQRPIPNDCDTTASPERGQSPCYARRRGLTEPYARSSISLEGRERHGQRTEHTDLDAGQAARRLLELCRSSADQDTQHGPPSPRGHALCPGHNGLAHLYAGVSHSSTACTLTTMAHGRTMGRCPRQMRPSSISSNERNMPQPT